MRASAVVAGWVLCLASVFISFPAYARKLVPMEPDVGANGPPGPEVIAAALRDTGAAPQAAIQARERWQRLAAAPSTSEFDRRDARSLPAAGRERYAELKKEKETRWFPWGHGDSGGAWRDWEWAVQGQAVYGPIRGYLQTPQGGGPGTTSPKRPKLSELDIDNVVGADVALAVGNDRQALYVGGRWIQPSSRAVLPNTLISHGVTFPAGSRVSTNLELNYYRLGYQYHFSLGRAGQESVRVSPTVELGLLDYRLKLDGPGGLRAERGFQRSTVRLGVEGEWRATDRLALDGKALASVPAGDLFITSVEATATYQLWDGPHATTGAAFVGLGYEHIDFEDDQTVTNHLNIYIGPLVRGGLQVRF